MSVPIKSAEFGPFWEKKFLSVLRKMRNNSGDKVKKSDYENLADRYIALGKLEGAKAKQVSRKIVKMWDDYYSQSAIKDEIGERALLQCIRDRKDRILETCLQIVGIFFDLADLNGDGVIREDEYALFLKLFGVENKTEVKKAFQVIDTNGNGELTHDEFLYAGCQYFMTNDETLPANFIFGPIM